jgi:DNA-binding transcriptional ArsR family regulator/uncharacterized protein YndB with AHSA1/START domain
VPRGDGQLQTVIDALASPIRREILWMVWDAELPAGEIAAAFDLTGATISTHLAALREAGLVSMRADGTFRRYRADRAAMEAVVPLLATEGARWQVADHLPELALAEAAVTHWVTVTTDLRRLDQDAAFASFTEPERFSAWLGVPVSIRDGRFATELEWGTKVRGHYEVQAAPELIALRWDFDDDAVPVPGRQLTGYVRFHRKRAGCRVEVHQRADGPEQASFLSTAWTMVLGRLREHDAATGTRPAARRPPRPKQLPKT